MRFYKINGMVGNVSLEVAAKVATVSRIERAKPYPLGLVLGDDGVALIVE